jgi:hypothetical protein
MSNPINCLVITSYKDTKSSLATLNHHFLFNYHLSTWQSLFLCVFIIFTLNNQSRGFPREYRIPDRDEDGDEILLVKRFKAKTRIRFRGLIQRQGALPRPRPALSGVPYTSAKLCKPNCHLETKAEEHQREVVEWWPCHLYNTPSILEYLLSASLFLN